MKAKEKAEKFEAKASEMEGQLETLERKLSLDLRFELFHILTIQGDGRTFSELVYFVKKFEIPWKSYFFSRYH